MIKSRQAILALLTALNLLNYLDRYVVAAIQTRMQESLSLDNTRIAWVMSAFMVGYMITSPIFGWLGDRYQRKGLIAAGIFLWSIATALSGLAHSLAPLIAARIVVGVGEASYATIGPTIIDDVAEKSVKSRFLAVFYAAIPIGSALGFIVGGWVEARHGWRAAFYVAGVPGIVLSLLTLLIHEPKRDASARIEQASRDVGVYLSLAKNKLYLVTIAGYIAQTFALGGFTFWAAPFLYRKLCMQLETAAYAFGAITAVTGLIGTAAGGWLADFWKGEDRVRVCLRICGWSSLLAAPLAFVALVVPEAKGAVIAIGACEIAVFASVAPTNVAVLQSVPERMRASAMAASILAIHLLGDLISPTAIGVISDAFEDKIGFCVGAPGLQTGMYLLPAALLVSALLWFYASITPRGAAAATATTTTADHSPR